MLDRQVIKEFLGEKLIEWETRLPSNIALNELTEAFCSYVEDDYYEWLEENTRSFFTVGSDGVDWDSIRGKIKNIK